LRAFHSRQNPCWFQYISLSFENLLLKITRGKCVSHLTVHFLFFYFLSRDENTFLTLFLQLLKHKLIKIKFINLMAANIWLSVWIKIFETFIIICLKFMTATDANDCCQSWLIFGLLKKIRIQLLLDKNRHSSNLTQIHFLTGCGRNVYLLLCDINSFFTWITRFQNNFSIPNVFYLFFELLLSLF
jgi:hypothetical protein